MKAVAATLAIVLTVVLSFIGVTSSPEPAQAQGQGCIIDVSGAVGLLICGGELVDRLPLPTVTVKVPPVTVGPIRVPGPTVTIPGPTQTVTVAPGPQETVTVTEPAETVTVNVPNGTQSVNPGPRPTQTVTEETTVTVSPDGQDGGTDDSVQPEDEAPAIDFGDGDTTVEEVGLGLLSLVAVFLVVLLSMYLGWRAGRKTGRDEETAFLRSLLNSTKTYRRQH